jgi:hypothetical protein
MSMPDFDQAVLAADGPRSKNIALMGRLARRDHRMNVA